MSISYAHNAEDIIINCLLGDVKTFIDIGANDGIKYSNVYKFINTGAAGLSFEPIPSIFRKLQKNYKDFPVHCINKAVSNKNDNVCMVDAGVLSHITTTADTGLTCKVIDTPEMPAINVWVDTIGAKDISYIWNKHFMHGSVPDVVSIDVEGHEHIILDNWDTKFLPKAFIIETHCYNGNELTWEHQHFDTINDILIHKFGYELKCSTQMNSIYIKKGGLNDNVTNS